MGPHSLMVVYVDPLGLLWFQGETILHAVDPLGATVSEYGCPRLHL